MTAVYSWEFSGRQRGGGAPGSGGGPGGLLVVLTANRNSGTFPLGVLFDATGTTSTNVTNPLRTITYDWTVTGGGVSGNYPYGAAFANGMTRAARTGRGWKFFCTFLAAGTTTVTVTANDGVTTASASLTITVADPAVTYAAASYFISTTGDTTGKPARSTLLTQSSVVQPANNTEYIYHDDQTFTGTVSCNNFSTGWVVKRSGAGTNKPIIDGFSLGSNPGGTYGAQQWSDLTIAGIKVAQSVSGQGIGNKLLCHQVDIPNTSTAGNYFDFGYTGTQEIFLSECTAFGITSNVLIANYLLWMGTCRMTAVVGCHFGTAYYHENRARGSADSYWSNNTYDGILSASGFHCLKQHANGILESYTDPTTADVGNFLPPGWKTRRLLNEDMLFGSPSSSNVSAAHGVAPQNTNYDEGVEDALIQWNVYANTSGGHLNVGGKNVIYRNNFKADLVTPASIGLHEHIYTGPSYGNGAGGGNGNQTLQFTQDFDGPYYSS